MSTELFQIHRQDSRNSRNRNFIEDFCGPVSELQRFKHLPDLTNYDQKYGPATICVGETKARQRPKTERASFFIHPVCNETVENAREKIEVPRQAALKA